MAKAIMPLEYFKALFPGPDKRKVMIRGQCVGNTGDKLS